CARTTPRRPTPACRLPRSAGPSPASRKCSAICGTRRLSLGSRPGDGRRRPRAASPEGYEFRVSDNGMGTPARDRDRAFDLFYRAAPARGLGVGVGLAVVKLLVEQSGGTLTPDSGEGQGTTVVDVLPRYDTTDHMECAP